MKIVLIGFRDSFIPNGMRCLEAGLVEAGHEVDLVILKNYGNISIRPTEREYEILTSFVHDLKPALIGISVISSFAWMAAETTERLNCIGVPIIWGGIHPTVAPELAIKKVDMIMRGEADLTLPLLAQKILSGGNLEEVPGLWWKEGDKILKNEIAFPVEDLDSLPFTLNMNERRWFVDNDSLIHGEPLLRSNPRIYQTLTSRGCPMHCSYCSNATLVGLYGSSAKRIRMYSPSRVVEEVKRFREKFGELNHVVFQDALFGYSGDWVSRFCDLWRKEIGKPFHTEMHPSHISEEKIARLKEAGLFFLSMGVQSGSERVRRDIYHRVESVEKIINAARILSRNEIAYRVDLIFGNPLEEAEDLKETLNFLLRLPRPFIANSFQLTFFPGTPITAELLEKGLISENNVHGYTNNVTSHWYVTVDLEDGHSPLYHFYLCLIFISDFRYYYYEDWFYPPRPHFYPKWLVRWLEKRSWLSQNPKAMLSIAKLMGKFAHGTYYVTSHYPLRLMRKTGTAFKLARSRDIKGLKAGFRQLFQGWGA